MAQKFSVLKSRMSAESVRRSDELYEAELARRAEEYEEARVRDEEWAAGVADGE